MKRKHAAIQPMPWKNITLTRDEERAIDSKARASKRTKFLVDENLGEGTAEFVADSGFNVEFVPEVGLGGKSDQDVFQYAWRSQRVLLTHDTDFLDDRRFPEYCNPGVIVLPGGSGDDNELGNALYAALEMFGKWPERRRGAKYRFTHSDQFRVKRRNEFTGAMEEILYRITATAMFQWEDS